ncbi:sensor histidine kinase [Polaromonas sp. CG_9.11]|uniref:sensor histidine kinase n=1 Tax=Polaromonas sp. CG_9.11 TaxID=2787730 RepID=UPI001A1A9E87|nr:nitrate/nitrite-specific signal transduction histidine kinase [Polaromonas sp. CG_9.11]
MPIRLQQRLLGEFNLFSRSAVTLSAEETELLDALAREAAVAEERAMLARELHDSTAQSLVFLKIQVQLLRIAAQKGQAEQMHQALQETLQKFQHQTGLPTHLKVHGDGLPLPPDVQVQVLHVLQEALSNVRQHAGASQVELEVLKGAQWRFRVRDDGIGFDSREGHGPTHVGMKIMRERADGIGAQVEIISKPGQGTTASLTLPAHPVAKSSGTAITGLALESLAGLMRFQ